MKNICISINNFLLKIKHFFVKKKKNDYIQISSCQYNNCSTFNLEKNNYLFKSNKGSYIPPKFNDQEKLIELSSDSNSFSDEEEL